MGVSILKAPGNFEEHFHLRGVVQVQGKGALHGIAVVDNVVVDAVFHGHGVLFQVGYQFFAVEDFLDVVIVAFQFQIADAVHVQMVQTVVDDVHATLDEKLRVVVQVTEPPSL